MFSKKLFTTRVLTVTLMIFVMMGCFFAFSACDSAQNHLGEIKAPYSSSMANGKDYNEVKNKFSNNGFTNIKCVKMEDLITGWLTKDGEVEDVSIGGKTNFSTSDWFSPNVEVVIRYHTFPSQKEEPSSPQEKTTLTIENCPALKAMLNNKADMDPSYAQFASKYAGYTMEFNACIRNISLHGDYTTRYDILFSAGNYDESHQIGPSFQFKDVNASNLGFSTLYLSEVLNVGDNVKIICKIDKYNTNSGIFTVKPVSVEKR